MYWSRNKNTNQAYIGNVHPIQATHLKYIYLKYMAEFHIDVVAWIGSLMIRKLILLCLWHFKRYNCLITWC